MRSIRIGAVLAIAMLLGACAQVPKQAFNREAATHVHNIVVTQNPNQTSYEAAILGHPGMSFGLIGGLVAAADIQYKSGKLTSAIDPAETRLQERFTSKLTEGLTRAGYQSTVVVLPVGMKDIDVVAYAKDKAKGDAVLVVYLFGGYWAAGPSTDYQPRLSASVKLVDLYSGTILYQDVISYGYAPAQSKTIHFASDAKYRFADIGVLTSDPALTRDGLFDGLDPVANQVADDIKRN
jgi:hypothetical protein